MGGCPCGGCIRGIRDPDRAEEKTESRVDDRAQRIISIYSEDREMKKEIEVMNAIMAIAQGKAVEMHLDPKTLAINSLLAAAVDLDAKFYIEVPTERGTDARENS